MIQLISLDRAKDYLRVDYEDEDIYIQSLIDLADIYVDSMVGKEYKNHEEGLILAEMLNLKLISDMYERRSTFVENSIKTDRITNSILDKLSNY